MEITRYVSEDMIEDLKNSELTIKNFIQESYACDKGYFAEKNDWFNVPIKILIPDTKEE